MSIGGGGLDTYESTFSSVDANSESLVTDSILIGDLGLVGIFVSAISGSHANHIVTLQISPGGSKWFDTDHIVTGIDSNHQAICIGDKVRAKIVTAEGSPSVIEIDIVSR